MLLNFQILPHICNAQLITKLFFFQFKSHVNFFNAWDVIEIALFSNSKVWVDKSFGTPAGIYKLVKKEHLKHFTKKQKVYSWNLSSCLCSLIPDSLETETQRCKNIPSTLSCARHFRYLLAEQFIIQNRKKKRRVDAWYMWREIFMLPMPFRQTMLIWHKIISNKHFTNKINVISNQTINLIRNVRKNSFF